MQSRVFVSLDEQERVQKKTFTKWINIYLSLHEPPYFIRDLYEDIKDGTKLIALLEALSGQTLVYELIWKGFLLISIIFFCHSSRWSEEGNERIL